MGSGIRIDNVRVPMRDGALLATDVILMDDGLPKPVFLARTPYSRASLRAGLDPVGLAREGWAVVLQDVRGRWDSTGEFTPYQQELADGADTVGWCADQPWSTGRVVTAGSSYDGVTQWLAALSGAPALRAISPTVSTPFVRDAWTYEGGALNLGFLINWGIGLGMLGTGPGGALRDDAMRHLDQWSAVVGDPRATDVATDVFPPFQRWLGTPDSDYWTVLDPHPRLPRTQVAGYHVAGWFDIFCEGSLAGYRALAHDSPEERVRRSQRLVVGPWTHGEVFGTTAGELDFGMAASGFARFPAEQRRFLWKAAHDQEVEGGVTVFITGSNRWVDLPTWPPPAEERALFLDGVPYAGGSPFPGGPARDGESLRLGTRPPDSAVADRWRHDPADPVPTRGGRLLHPGLNIAGPVAQGDLALRPDVLAYTGDPLSRDLTVAGPVRAVLLFETDAPRTDVVAKLVDVHPAGRGYNVVDSVQRVTATSGRPTWVTVELGSTAHTFRAGHRIQLHVASSNAPRFDHTPAADQAIWRGPAARSRLLLPVVEPG